MVSNNAAGNKVVFYADRTVVYRAGLLPDGGVGGRATVTLRNDAATAGLPAHELGHPVFGTSFTLPSGESTELAYRWRVPGA